MTTNDPHHAEAAALAAKIIPSVAALIASGAERRPVMRALRDIEDLRDGTLVCRVATLARSIMLDDARDARRMATLATMVG